jgi:hypothetical protein
LQQKTDRKVLNEYSDLEEEEEEEELSFFSFLFSFLNIFVV